MLAKVASVGVLGIEAYPIEVECNVARGLRAVAIVSLPDAAVKESVEALIEQAMVRHAFSARSYTRTLEMAPTIADLAGSDGPQVEHLSEAIQYRSTERHFWR